MGHHLIRAQDKRKVVATWLAGADLDQAAARLSLPAQEVRAIYAKEKKSCGEVLTWGHVWAYTLPNVNANRSADMKAGTQIKVRGIALDGSATYEDATIARWNAANGKKSEAPAGYHPVKFNSGGKMMIHESNMVIAGEA